MSAKARHQIFLVDDHPLVREWLTNLINQQPDLAVCGEAEDAAHALQAIAKLRPDVAIVDLSLKSASGLELIKDLKLRQPQVIVLVLSMHDESLYAERALRAGARGYIMKRETAKKVIGAIRQVIAGELCVSEKFAAVMARKFLEGGPVSGSPIALLSDRELEVFQLLGQGYDTRRIAAALSVNFKTVQSYCARIKDKLRLNNATALLREAIRWEESRHAPGRPAPPV